MNHNTSHNSVKGFRPHSDTTSRYCFKSPEQLIAPQELNATSMMRNQNFLFAPSQAMTIDPLVDLLSGCTPDFSTNMQFSPDLAQQRHWKGQGQGQGVPKKALIEAQRQTQLQARSRYMRDFFQQEQSQQRQQQQPQPQWHHPTAQRQQHQLHDRASAQHDLHFQPRSVVPQRIDSMVQQRQQLDHLSCTATEPQPGSSQRCRSGATQSSKPLLYSRSREAVAVAPHPQLSAAACARIEAAHRNEEAELARLKEDQRQELEKHTKRRDELQKDTTVLYHNYLEYMEYFPRARGERPNPYLTGLLANQPMPADATSNLGIAIRYAKRHFYYYWDMRDLEHVVAEAKDDIEKKAEERKQSGCTMTRRRELMRNEAD